MEGPPPASHAIEIALKLPPDFPFGGVSSVPGILMKPAEETRGDALAGAAVKTNAEAFVIRLSGTEGDKSHDVELLKGRSWLDIPIIYTNGRRAILAIEKGTTGERAFQEAFSAWGE